MSFVNLSVISNLLISCAPGESGVEGSGKCKRVFSFLSECREKYIACKSKNLLPFEFCKSYLLPFEFCKSILKMANGNQESEAKPFQMHCRFDFRAFL